SRPLRRRPPLSERPVVRDDRTAHGSVPGGSPGTGAATGRVTFRRHDHGGAPGPPRSGVGRPRIVPARDPDHRRCRRSQGRAARANRLPGLRVPVLLGVRGLGDQRLRGDLVPIAVPEAARLPDLHDLPAGCGGARPAAHRDRRSLGDDLSSGRPQTPARVISPIRIDGVPTLEKKRRSLPTPATSESISGSVEAIVISRSGSPVAPPWTRSPVAPTLNSPLIGLAPECTPETSMISTPPSALARSWSYERSPGSTKKLE